MSGGRGLAIAAAASIVAAIAGCGFGSGSSSTGEATLTVTRDYGNQRLLEATSDDPSEAETVLRFLDREAEIETRYGGRFVQAIAGVEGTAEDGRSLDWFFYRNGIESPVGAADVEVRVGDRIWWDHRDWTDAMRVPAVVGSWPEPFLNGAGGNPVTVLCRSRRPTCDEVVERLEDEGVDVAGGDGPTVLVGPWRRLRAEAVARQFDDGPQASGVFAAFERKGLRLAALDERGGTVAELGRAAGLVAALRDGDDPPTWLVTGTDEAGVRRAAGALSAPLLRDRYAIAVQADGTSVPLPARGEPD